MMQPSSHPHSSAMLDKCPIHVFFAGASEGLPCMWPQFAGARGVIESLTRLSSNFRGKRKQHMQLVCWELTVDKSEISTIMYHSAFARHSTISTALS